MFTSQVGIMLLIVFKMFVHDGRIGQLCRIGGPRLEHLQLRLD